MGNGIPSSQQDCNGSISLQQVQMMSLLDTFYQESDIADILTKFHASIYAEYSKHEAFLETCKSRTQINALLLELIVHVSQFCEYEDLIVTNSIAYIENNQIKFIADQLMFVEEEHKVM